MAKDDIKRALLDMIKILEKGIVMEHNAREFYLSAAQKVAGERGREMLQWLADFEAGHESRLRAKRDELLEHPSISGTSARPPDDYTVSEAGGWGTLSSKSTDIDILKVALDNEKKAYAFFQRKITHAADPTVETLFRELARDEERHVRIIGDQLQHLKTNQLWMDMKEFDDYMQGRKK
jgi:rubrerythrin